MDSVESGVLSETVQLVLVSDTADLEAGLLAKLGRRCHECLRLDPRDVARVDWQNQRRTGSVWAVVAPPGSGVLRRDTVTHWTQALSIILRPRRLVVLVESMDLDEILPAVRAGADGVLVRSATPDEVVAELERSGTRARDYFPDPQNWLGALRRASEELGLSIDPKTQMLKLLRIFVAHLRVDRCSILLLDDDGNLRLVAGQGMPDQMAAGTVVSPKPGTVSAWVLDNRRARLVEGTLDATASRHGRVVRSAITVPLLAREKLLGLANFSSFDANRRFGASDLAAAEVFGSLIAMAVSTHRLHQENLAAERLSTIGRTIAHVSHSIKNVIQILNGSKVILKQGIDSNDPQRLRDGFLMNERAMRRLEGLVMDLLDYCKERPPDLQPTDLGALLESVRQHYFEPLRKERHRLEIACSVPDEVPLDERRLQLALYNLLSNAIDVMPSGGTIRIEATHDGRTTRIVVRDEGPGVPEADLTQIFDPLFSTKGSKGTGLGLAMVKKFAEECGGRVLASNHPEGGLAITLELPMPAQTPEPGASYPPPDRAARR
jgi:signal transduction histidine kinase